MLIYSKSEEERGMFFIPKTASFSKLVSNKEKSAIVHIRIVNSTGYYE